MSTPQAIKASNIEAETPEDRERLEELYAIGKEIPPVPEDLPDPNYSDNAWYIGRTRYAFRDKDGTPIESPRQMLWRICYNIATAERLYSENPRQQHLEVARVFYGMMARQEYVANTPTMLNAGKPNEQLSACFVLPVPDDLNGILDTATDMARIHKSGGGTGFSFSRLRPKGDVIQSSGGTTTGPVAFMQTYNDVTSSIRQGGVRRGANMGILHYNHPDILLFAIYKVDEFSLTNFNISVTVDEAFYEAVKRDGEHLPADYEDALDFEGLMEEVREAHQTRDLDLKLVRLDAVVKKLHEWADESDPNRGYALVNPHTKQETGRLNAKKMYDLITRLAYQYGDPGMIMIDRINNSRANPTPQLGMIEATNPCGEQPLLPYDACTLGQINLAKFVNEAGDDFDWERLRAVVHNGTRFLDDVLDMNEYPIEAVRITTRAIRRIGLGIMGYADALLQMNIGYNTPEGNAAAERVMKFVQAESDNASIDLARVRGVFPAFKGSIYDKAGEIRPRNGARTTIAPTGTTAMLADCSSGCEPLFALTYSKNTIEGKRMFQSSPYFVRALEERGLYSEELLEKIQANGGSIQNMDELPEDLRRTFVVAGDITPEWHLKAQAAFQKYTDNAISKTINFNNEATVQDVRDAYWMAYESGCKGITIYRDGSRQKQILEVKKDGSYYDQLAGKKLAAGEAALVGVPVEMKPRPGVLAGHTYKVATPIGTAFISINEDDEGNIFEVFVNLGRAGSDIMADAEAMGRLISLAFRIPSVYSSDRIAQNVVEQLNGIGGSGAAGFGPQRVRSLADAVAKVLREHESTKAGEQAAVVAGAGVADSTAASSANVADAPMGPAAVAAPASTAVAASVNLGAKAQTDLCPECGNASLRFIEGCQKCEICGFSKC
ncbi:MAG TPA: adenosylcobalamin-dependent ribonucleoside-diphosphate reductase [Candidatus Saccharimonadia bacterium]|nr:adenosylcobalamin-dependent ribonucleoside-diphosphate reductase [Candidatus Saccharimonadia bacterium]